MRARIESSDRLPPRLAAFALEALDRCPDGDRLCHGDFHPGNVLVGGDGPLVIDWTAATRSDPAADVARTMFLLRSGAPMPGTPAPVRAIIAAGRKVFARFYLKGYRQRASADPAAIRAWEVPTAAARLAEGIEEETESLLSWLQARHRAREPQPG